ncbi:MAG TPA: 2-phosphosulfolactate phosphatase family protein [Pseudothermotoga sp.]|uniref:2-phosphosulfolactate phosphatase family protein n=1 Tax=Thermotoga profunda TaxID=1508420 RepID=UPI000596CB47|nr:2-phosphosulfolactate phosphatase family protein [Thermotoga profunda]
MIDVLFLPKPISQNDTCVIVDVLRATSTIVTALANGAKCVIPVKTISQARGKKRENTLICGERGGIRPRGFDLGNSPKEYFDVKDKEIILTTTNGTKAISMVNSQILYAACFLNLHAVVDQLKNHKDVTVICSGQEGKVTYEDVLCAGAIVHELCRNDLTDAARISKELWSRSKNKNLSKLLMKSNHAQELVKYGFSSDISFCSQVDLYNIVPSFVKDRFIIE